MKTLQSFILALSLITSVTVYTQTDADRNQISANLDILADAWATADGEKFASVFTDDHDFVVWNGFYFPNCTKQQNAANHNGIFNSIYKDTQLFYSLDKIKFLTDNVALAHVYGAVAKNGEPRPADPQVLFTALSVKKEGKWLITSFHNLDLEIFENENMKAAMPLPAEKMYAGWYNVQ